MLQKLLDKLDYLVLIFVRRYYNPQLTYTSSFYQSIIDKAVDTAMLVLINGFVWYLILSGAIFIFPLLSYYIFLGTKLWHIIPAVLYLGILSLSIMETYRFFRIKYKGGK